MKADAIAAIGDRKVEIREVEIGGLGEWDILVELEASSISVGTESYVLSMPERYERPYIPGYAPIGRIIECGKKAAKSFALGDRVSYFCPRAPIGILQNCGSHQSPAIMNVNPENLSPSNGYCEKVPESLGSDLAAYGGIASISSLGIGLAKQRVGDRALVIGQGMIGQLAAQFLKLWGAEVTAADLFHKRLELAQTWGVDHVINASTDDLVDSLKAIWSDGADIVVDCTGLYRVVEAAVPAVKTRGKFVFLGWCKGLDFNLELFHGRIFEAYFPWGLEGPRVSHAWRLMDQGLLEIAPLITHRFPMHAAQAAYDLIYSSPQEYVGILLDWQSHGEKTP